VSRSATAKRATKETDIEVTLELDGTGTYDVQTPIPFLTHMLEQIARHGLFDLKVRAKGDVDIDGHHTTEDLAVLLGQAFAQALGDKSNIARYGHATLPMDEARATVAVDLSGRPYFVWEVSLPKAKLGDFDAELVEVFFEGFVRGAACNLHVVLSAGRILHHMVEVCFKSLAKALSAASRVEPRGIGIPSTKGTLS
jgi:imidazoleglycerol-phosphate dehydratase